MLYALSAFIRPCTTSCFPFIILSYHKRATLSLLGKLPLKSAVPLAFAFFSKLVCVGHGQSVVTVILVFSNSFANASEKFCTYALLAK